MLITSQFQDPTLRSDDFAEVLRRMSVITELLAEKSGRVSEWFARGMTQEEAFLYPAFEKGEPSTALLAVLNHKYHEDKSFTYVSIWNGAEIDSEAMALTVHLNNTGRPGRLKLAGSSAPGQTFGRPDLVRDVVERIISHFPSHYVSVGPEDYFSHQVFKDKPGVGWMLYLPRIITAEQVPEAEALIPLPAPGKKQTGTLIVSVANEVFSLDNPRHIEVANQIELRLVDQDLIERYEDMYWSA